MIRPNTHRVCYCVGLPGWRNPDRTCEIVVTPTDRRVLGIDHAARIIATARIADMHHIPVDAAASAIRFVSPIQIGASQ